MCGICGAVHRDHEYSLREQTLLAMRDIITHRGPDDAGQHLMGGVALGSRRLAILDLSPRGHMPMNTPDGRYWITYNGEVYNYAELRSSLEARGYEFRSNTDTEVLLNLYAADGPAMLDRCNGMFAFAIWDSVERTLFMARDRLGVKPLYYAQKDGAFYFASEEKALFKAGIPAQFDPDTLEELICFRYLAGERTPFVGVKRLLPGHYLIWKDGRIQIKRWWNLGDRARQLRESPPGDPVRWYGETFDSAVDLRRISDVPVGVLLSGGLDSGSVAASLALQAGSGVSSFTVRFDEPGYDEGPLARQVAERWNLDYHELRVTPDDLPERVRSASFLNDEPLVHGNDLYLWAISAYAKPYVTVLLSGEGADETLGGYVRYQPLRYPALLRAARPVLPGLARRFKLPARIDKLGRFLDLGGLERFVLYNSCEVLPGELQALGAQPRMAFPFREQVLAEAKQLYPRNYMRQAMYSDQHTFLCSILDRNDRMTMGASIECRVPFLDYRLVEGVAALPDSVVLAGKRGKHLLRASVGSRLPEAVLTGRKWGFGVPWKRYLRGVPELREVVEKLPGSEPVIAAGFSREKLRRAVSGFFNGDPTHEGLIKQLVMISMWHDTYFERVAQEQQTEAETPFPVAL